MLRQESKQKKFHIQEMIVEEPEELEISQGFDFFKALKRESSKQRVL